MKHKDVKFYLEPEFLEYFNAEGKLMQLRILDDLRRMCAEAVARPVQKMDASKRAALADINGKLKIIGQFVEL